MLIKPYQAHLKVKRAIGKGKLSRPDVCERCGARGRVDGHHDDYNKPLVVKWLCRKCHMAIDGRAKKFGAMAYKYHKHGPQGLCHNCRRLIAPRRKGRCHACDMYLRVNGRERPYREDGRVEKKK